MELADFGTVFAPGYTLSVEERAALEVQVVSVELPPLPADGLLPVQQLLVYGCGRGGRC